MKTTPKNEEDSKNKDDLKNKDNLENEDDSGLIFFILHGWVGGVLM